MLGICWQIKQVKVINEFYISLSNFITFVYKAFYIQFYTQFYVDLYVGKNMYVNQEKWVLGSFWNGENPIQILIGRKVREN